MTAVRVPMMFRFSLYGFLKNQRYFEPFLILAFRARGLSFTEIGLLIGFREIAINLMEVPSGAVADVTGRRRSMVISFLSYIGAFVLLAFAHRLLPLLLAMLLFAAGEAFRTGTHKAIIFHHLSLRGRSHEKTRVYGYTRSWSKMGSAVSVLVAAALVFTVEVHDYVWVFVLSIVPYVANVLNLLTYPAHLDGSGDGSASPRRFISTTVASLRQSMRRGPLRRILGESMTYEGVYRSTKDYIQPLLRTAALGLPMGLSLQGRQRTALLTGAAYFVLYLASSVASRHAHVLSRRAGSDERGATWLWAITAGGFALLTAALYTGRPGLAAAVFVLLALLQNLWRPITIARVADRVREQESATVLSIESQAKSLFAAVLAPLIGLAVDLLGGHVSTTARFLPVAIVGLAATGVVLARRRGGSG